LFTDIVFLTIFNFWKWFQICVRQACHLFRGLQRWTGRTAPPDSYKSRWARVRIINSSFCSRPLSVYFYISQARFHCTKIL